MKLLQISSLVVALLLTPALPATPITQYSMYEDLQRVVQVCAVEPRSDQFTAVWTEFVRKHYEAGIDLERIIDDVLARAGARRENRHAATGELSWTADTRAQVRQHMQITAVRTIRELS